MTYTCATEGCGGPIEWREYVHEMRWVHEQLGIIGCRAVHRKLKGSWPEWSDVAHPAGGTNTTPPEELERDVKKVTMDQIEVLLWSRPPAREARELIQSYADQAAEEATTSTRERMDYWRDKANEARDELYRANVRAEKLVQQRDEARAELADLREQMDQALVSRFKVGDLVVRHNFAYPPETIRSIRFDDIGISYQLNNGEIRYWMETALSLAPLETECEHHPVRDLSARGTYGSYEMYPFCPKCGESLTKEDA